MDEEFEGVYAALLTPFNSYGNIDKKAIPSLLEFLISNNINGVYVCGNTGQGLLLNVEERKKILDIVKNYVETKIKIIAHIGCMNTRDSLELARHAKELGVDGIASLPPIYYPYKIKDIYKYYNSLARLNIPLFIYYIPSATHSYISLEEFMDLINISNIRGMKYTDKDLFTLQELIRLTNNKWVFFSGSDELFLPCLTLGVKGCIGSLINVIPEVFVKLYKSFHSNNISEAMRLQQIISATVSLFKKYGLINACKTVLEYRGINIGYSREPLQKKLNKQDQNNLLVRWKMIYEKI